MPHPPIVYSGATAKSLKSILDLNGNSTIISGTNDPTLVSTTATEGSLYLNTTNARWFQNTNGTTGWSVVVGKAACFSGATTYATKMTNTSLSFNLQFNTSTYNQLGTNTLAAVSIQNLTTTSASAAATAVDGSLVALGQIVVSANVPANTSIANISGNNITLNQNATGTGTVSTTFSQWKWFVPVTGIYRCNVNVRSAAISPAAASTSLLILVNSGTEVAQLTKMYPIATSKNIPGGGCVEMSLTAGDFVWWRWFTGITTDLVADPIYSNCAFSWVSGV